MRSIKLGLLVVLPSFLAYLVVNMQIPLPGDAWLVSPFGWGVVFLVYWFWVGSLFGLGRNPTASFLWGTSLTFLFGILYLQQFYWTAPADRSPFLSLLGQLYAFLTGPVSSVFLVSVLGASGVSGVALNLWAYAIMLAVFSLGFLWRRQKQAPRGRRRKR